MQHYPIYIVIKQHTYFTNSINTIMTIQECYDNLQGNYDEAKSRLMNDKLIDRFVRKFLEDPSMDTLRKMIADDDKAASFRAVHTLKGVAANLAFTALHKDAQQLTEQLRDCVSSPDPVLVENLEASYKMTIDAIRQYEAEL